MRKFLLILAFFAPALALAAHGGDASKDYDFIPRLINFILFFGILYYLLKKHVVALFNGRSEKIANRLKAIEDTLQESERKRAQAVNDLQKAKENASELVEIAKKEAELIKEKIASQTQNEISNLEKNLEGQKEFEQRKMKKSVVAEILDEVFEDKSISLSPKELINIVQKKAS